MPAVLAAGILAVSAHGLPTADSLAARVAGRYGLAEFPKVKSIHFVFNVMHDGKTMDREWTWFPKADSVIYKGKDPAGADIQAAYSRHNAYSMGQANVIAIDKMFVNDQYWFLFPLHLGWDKELKKEVAAVPPGAAKNGEVYKLTAMYPVVGGYTPGDAYDLFVDSSGAVRRWIFRKGNASAPTVEATWSAPEKKGDLQLSLERPGAKPGFKVWFTNVDVLSASS